MPLHTIEKPGFLHLLKKMDPRYHSPSKHAMSRTHIPKLYDVTREKGLRMLKTATTFAATTDMWSSHGMTPYMGYSIHFIDDDWTLQHIDLGTSFMPEDHTADNLKEAMGDMLEQWGLKASNQVCITTDSGANVIKAVKDLRWEHLSCFGHNLHLGITKSYSSTTQPEEHRAVSRSLRVAHQIVSKFNTSWKRKRDLRAAQVKSGKDPKFLISVSDRFYFTIYIEETVH